MRGPTSVRVFFWGEGVPGKPVRARCIARYGRIKKGGLRRAILQIATLDGQGQGNHPAYSSSKAPRASCHSPTRPMTPAPKCMRHAKSNNETGYFLSVRVTNCYEIAYDDTRVGSAQIETTPKGVDSGFPAETALFSCCNLLRRTTVSMGGDVQRMNRLKLRTSPRVARYWHLERTTIIRVQGNEIPISRLISGRTRRSVCGQSQNTHDTPNEQAQG